jgi:hypothetical protein
MTWSRPRHYLHRQQDPPMGEGQRGLKALFSLSRVTPAFPLNYKRGSGGAPQGGMDEEASNTLKHFNSTSSSLET